MTDPRIAQPDVVADAWVMIGRTVRLTLRDPAALVLAVFVPVVLMLLMTAGFAEIVRPGAGYSAYLDFSLPLFVLMGIVFAALTTAVLTVRDLNSGMDSRLRTFPMARSAPLVGRIAGDLLRNAITVVTVVAIGLGLGFRFHTNAVSVLGFFVLPLVFGIGVAWCMVAVAVRARSAESVVTVLNAALLVLSFLSTGFVPLDALPGWAQPVAAVNPISSVVEAMRVLAHGGDLAATLPAALAWPVGLTVVFGAVSVRGYRQREL